MTVVDLYTIQLIQEEDKPKLWLPQELADHIMAETEENLTDLLPPGYRARIRRWNHADPDETNPGGQR